MHENIFLKGILQMVNVRVLSLTIVLCAVLLATRAPCHAEQFAADCTVAADGSGDFETIQAAIDSVPLNNCRRVVIEVRDGLYNEKVRIDRNCVTLRGVGRERAKIAYNLPRPEYDRRYDRIGPGVVNVFGEDLVLEHLTIENTQKSHGHAFAIYGQPNRFILDDCAVLGEGGDTLSLWNTTHGMYYHRNCFFRGGVDFVCPRGWCFVRDSRFESVGTSAAIWHDGHINLSMKFVMRDCDFDGPDGFWIGRNQYPCQFYLLGCRFTERMADKPILLVKDPKPGVDGRLYERKYFSNCQRQGGNYPWFADNLQTAAGSPTADRVTPAWTFNGKWDPERTDTPHIESVEVEGDQVHVYFSERLAGADDLSVVRRNGSKAAYHEGEGTRHFVFAGGDTDSSPEQLEDADGQLHAVTATLAPRRLSDKLLPPSKPWKRISVLLVGDSTVASYGASNASQGWGWALEDLLDSRASVLNHARGGRSSKSFRDEGWWDEALRKKPDYMIIQFGHNDNPGKGPERETDPSEGGDYRENLRHYIIEAREAGASPVLVSPPTRRFYLDDGLIDPAEGNIPYAEATLAVGREQGCPVIDLNTLTRDLFNRLEENHSDWLQPNGDRTHFTPSGAKRIACLVAAKLAQQVTGMERLVIQEELSRH